MGLVNKPYGDINNGTTSDANVVDQQMNTLYTLVNGNIEDANVKAGSISAGIASEGVKPSQTKGVPYATDLFNAPFIFSGAVPTKDGTTLSQINIPAYVAYATQTDGTLRRITTTATTKQVTTPSSTFYLDLNPDGTFSWGSHSTQANYLTICTVVSDASSNVSTITDTRPTQVNLLGGSVGLKSLGDVNSMYAFRNLLDPSKQSFTRASNATRKDLTPVPFNVLRTEQGRFGQGAFIEESTTNLPYNTDFETITGTATVFSDAMTAGTTADPAWTVQGGSFTWSTSGATSGANGSIITAGNNAWKPLTGSNGTALSLTVQATFTTQATLTGNSGLIELFQSSGNNYYANIDGTNGKFWLVKTVGGAATNLASVAQTFTTNTAYTITLAITPNGGLTAKLYSGVGTGGTLLQTLTATDTSLTGGFLLGVGGDTGVVIKNAQVTAPFADGWTPTGDQRVAWALTSTNPISGSYSVSAVGVSGVTGYIVTGNFSGISASVAYALSAYLNTSSVGAGGAWMEVDWLDSTSAYLNKSTSATVTGTTNTNRLTLLTSSVANTAKANVQLKISDVGTVVFDAIQLEAKPYPTTYVRNDSISASATRNADSLSYTLSNPLPSRYFGALVWTPEQGSNNTRQRAIYFDTDNTGASGRGIQFNKTSGCFSFEKQVSGQTNQVLSSSPTSFNAGDRVFLAWLDDDVNGVVKIWVGINGGTLSTYSMSVTGSCASDYRVYVGSWYNTGYESNGTIDFPILTDVIPTADQVQALYQASDWGGDRNYPGVLPNEVTFGANTRLAQMGGTVTQLSNDQFFNISAKNNTSIGSGVYWDGSNYVLYSPNVAGVSVRGNSAQGRAEVLVLPANSAYGTSPNIYPLLQALSGGYKVQSGNFSVSATQNAWASQVITFPTAFSSLTGVFAFVYGNQLRVYTSASGTSTTGATIYCYNTDATSTLYVTWIAIGS